jgi:hypothetical protein
MIEGQILARLHKTDATGRQKSSRNLHVEIASTPCNQSWRVKRKRKTAHRNFETGRSLLVFKQEIGDAQGVPIERAASRDAETQKTGAPQILHGR